VIGAIVRVLPTLRQKAATDAELAACLRILEQAIDPPSATPGRLVVYGPHRLAIPDA
jgi:hypothetical protein